jgi:hypothetical protein
MNSKEIFRRIGGGTKQITVRLLARPEVEERFGLSLEAPQNREAAFKAMWQDQTTHYWVLDYYFAK